MKTKRIPRDLKTEQNTDRNGNRTGYHHTVKQNRIPPAMKIDEDANRYQNRTEFHQK